MHAAGLAGPLVKPLSLSVKVNKRLRTIAATVPVPAPETVRAQARDRARGSSTSMSTSMSSSSPRNESEIKASNSTESREGFWCAVQPISGFGPQQTRLQTHIHSRSLSIGTPRVLTFKKLCIKSLDSHWDSELVSGFCAGTSYVEASSFLVQ